MSGKTLYERPGGYDAADLLPRPREDPQPARFWPHR